MPTLTMHQVDAFTDRVFAGNPAAVLILDDWLPEETMQAIANENNLAETAFARPNSSGWDLRWFTPVHEVNFCGHATLATAHVLASAHCIPGEIEFATRVGPIRVSQQGKGYRLDLPAFAPEPIDALPPAITALFPVPPRALFRNFENVFAVLADEKAVRTFVPDAAAIATLAPLCFGITARGESHDFVSRYFAPSAGIPEDPVTGSIHATLVPYWARELGKTRLEAFQASARGGHLGCELAGERVLVTGQAVTFMKAEIYLPN
ncbi:MULTISPECIES: PhzF family phenazine biosynthesis protein [unclassified Bosea (in: a-proteobacteria)]|uniref:PhzF family phenazine biosynthesis protein n=1 Tax=unclassified Bosea (in: a-proteobacteria) TaxID=2653178 RepID=UPI000F76538E|nr:MULTISPECIES: PhzF family phenazine biosynthesis protein [unclassified Bosea (in: a-proteobacteria)]AZO78733.1 phenazine biosynthesis protein PhzF family [Bosea sp. Tri-49]RXT17479.1 phenazine biosynthesis protein PhzF family [Bosea sp. Tri-39]RXT40850.1 phenazine biosynthesis protein PhzF family [Bosea sp. Tri-54]